MKATKLFIILLAIMLTASAMPANVTDARMTANGANLTVNAPDGEYTVVSSYDATNRVDFAIVGGVGQVKVNMTGWAMILDRNGGLTVAEALVGVTYLNLPAYEEKETQATWYCPPNLPPWLSCAHGGVR